MLFNKKLLTSNTVGYPIQQLSFLFFLGAFLKALAMPPVIAKSLC